MKIKSRSLVTDRNSFARFVSSLFLPTTFSLLTFTYLHIFFRKEGNFYFLSFCFSVLSTVVIPIVFFIIQRNNGKISDNDAVNKDQRNVTYLFLIFIYSLTTLALHLIGTSSFIVILMMAYSINTLIVLLINLFFKISIHTFTAFGSSAVFCFVSQTVFLILSVLGLLVGWSRIKLGVHTKLEVLLGMILGFFLTYFEFKILLRIYETL